MSDALRGNVTSTLHGIAFSFYTADQIKALSVKRIAVTPAFDLQGVPLPDGLYDPALGPLSANEVCTTCSLQSRFCPGHCGHVELPVPIINPLLFKQCYAILKRTCFNCHRLKVRGGAAARDRFLLQMALLEQGKVWEAMAVPLDVRKHRDDGEQGIDLVDEDAMVKALKKLHAKEAADVDGSQNLLRQTRTQELADSLLRECQLASKCPFCKCISPPLRQYDNTKVLADPLLPKFIHKNQDAGVEVYPNVFDQPEWDGQKQVKVAGRQEREESQDDLDHEDDGGDDDEDEELEDAEDDEVREDTTKVGSDFASRRESLRSRRWLSPLEVREHLRRLWKNEPDLCRLLWNHLVKRADGKFERVPTHCDVFFMEALVVPPNRFRPPSRTTYGGKVGAAEHSHNLHLNRIIEAATKFTGDVRGKAAEGDVMGIKARLWSSIQVFVAAYFNSTAKHGVKDAFAGIQQVLDKKEGLFRRNMMGKRVNYAARTVISPDPYLQTDEIGVPQVFAEKLTVPTPVTWLNHERMAQAVVNGTSKYPGAIFVEKDGFKKRLESMPQSERVALSKQLMERNPLAPDAATIVHAHVQSGDYVLLNRQPSLHKPSMLGQRVKVLGQERVMRMHYANCNSFNADFDGDEMNIHLPQSLNARADIRFAAMSRDNYLGPKDGAPLRGLIQDHVLSGVLLTMKDTFFKREEYQQLIYGAVFSVRPVDDIVTDPPAILKPVPLWTGKQVISAIVKHILRGKPLFHYKGSSRVKGDIWGPSGAEEGSVEFRGGDLVTGIIDKAQCGASNNGFVHSCYTLYGGDVAERLLSCLGCVFTKYLHSHGFTCGMDDFLLSSQVEEERRKVLDTAQARSSEVMRTFLDADPDENDDQLRARLKARLTKTPMDEALVDGVMKKVSHSVTSSVVDLAIPRGMKKRFPYNNFYMMVVTGAKGSTVNFSMIACCLGQMELEGKRVARMVSGRTLPSFQPYQIDVTAGGFISQRFLTGVKPREFYFHNMAGREGLVDTAVKTSRSGYLQRCIIKHLESVKVAYDGTVRDSDGSIVQFVYGEDGLDPVHHASVFNLNLWRTNADVAKMRVPRSSAPFRGPVAAYHNDFYDGTLNRYPENGPRLHVRSDKLMDGSLLETHSPSQFGVVSDKFLTQLRETGIEKGTELYELMIRNYQRLLVNPGDSVGVLAGQSIGEPSTQMTLNTFHLAGHGDVNVTLGIPRLRELLMGATKPKVPSMTVEVRNDVQPEVLAEFKQRWKNAKVENIVSEVVCSRVLPADQSFIVLNILYFKFDEASYSEYGLTWGDVVKLMRDQVSTRLCNEMVRDLRHKASRQLVQEESPAPMAGNEDAEDEAGEEGPARKKRAGNKKDAAADADDDAEDEEEEDENAPAKGNDDLLAADEEDELVLDRNGAPMDVSEDEPFDSEEMADLTGLGTHHEFVGTVDADGFLSQKVPVKLSNPNHDYLRLVGISSHSKERVVRLRIITKQSGPQVLISSMAEWVAKTTPIRFMPDISRTLFIEADGDKPASVVTEGCNIPWMAHFSHILEMSQIRCNDIGHVLENYGVEAARSALVEELAAVFAAYGINVGNRHLTLIADYQTFHGGYRGFNRHGMSMHKNSPLLNMSFETTTRFASDAALRGAYEDCTSSSAQLVLGTVPDVGSGCMDLLLPLNLDDDNQ